MDGWNKLLVLLDAMFGLPNKAASRVKKLQQGFDNRTQEHVIWIEYRVRVTNSRPLKLTEDGSERRASLLSALIS
mgnify:CR=1 FL=1